MKYFFLLLVAGFTISCKAKKPAEAVLPAPVVKTADTLPAPVGAVNDFASVLTPVQRDSLETMLRQYQQATTNAIAIVTIDSVPYGGKIEVYAEWLLNKWGLGTKEKNNGVLLLFAMKDRKMRIQLGSGIESLVEGQGKPVIDSILVPHFKQQDYYNGMRLAVLDIIRQLN